MTDFAPPIDPPPSPFLPDSNIQYAIDSTTLNYMKTCPRMYQYTMLEGRVPKDESIHLRFGREYHQALQDYDMSRVEGIPHDDALHDVIRELLIRTWNWNPDLDSKAGKYKNRDSLVRTVVWYLDGTRRNDNYSTYILSNGRPAVELSFRFELPFGPAEGRPYLLCGHLDRVCTDGIQGKDNDLDLYVEDHKTTTQTLSDYFFNQFEPNNQMSLYTFAGQMILEAPIKGIIINGVQLMIKSPDNGEPATRFVRGFTFRTQDHLEEWVRDLDMWLKLYEWYAETGYYPMNEASCGNFGGCRFRGVCSKSPQVREIYLKSNFNKLEESERWNPLRSR